MSLVPFGATIPAMAETNNSAGEIGELGLPLLERGLEIVWESDNLELQKEALRSAGRMGEPGLPLLERGFKSGDPVLLLIAAVSALLVGEPGLPLLKKSLPWFKINLENKNLDEDIRNRMQLVFDDIQYFIDQYE